MKQYNKLFAILFAVLGVTTLQAQTDVTSQYLTNADFSSTTGWTAYASSDYRDFGYGKIGSYKVRNDVGTAATTDATHLSSEYCFGFEVRWASNYASYNQEAKTELPNGVYTLTYDVQNTNANTTAGDYESLFYVKVGDKTYTDISTEWMNGGTGWTTHSISFIVNSASKATISLGLGSGTTNNPHANTPVLYVSHLKLTHKPLDEVTETNPVDLTSMVSNSKNAWTGASETPGYDGITMVAVYKGSDWTGEALSQTINGLPAGNYKMEVYCQAHSSWDTDVAAEGATGYTYLCANEYKLDVPIRNADGAGTKLLHTFEKISITNGTLKISVMNEKKAANWISIYVKSLTFLGPDKTLSEGAFNKNYEAISKLNTNVPISATFATEIQTLKNEFAGVSATTLTQTQLDEANGRMQNIINEYDANINAYAKLKKYIDMTAVFTNVAAYETKYNNGEYTLADVEPTRQELNVMRFNAASAIYTNKVNVTGWTGSMGERSDQHWSGTTISYKDANSWNDIEDDALTTTINLTKGNYVLKVAGRSHVNALLTLEVLNQKIEFHAKGDTGYGIDINGNATFDAAATYANNGAGRGWEWEFLKFSLDADQTVTLSVNSRYNNNWQVWNSFGDITLWMDDATYVTVNGDAINAPKAEAEKLVNTLPMGNAEKTALQKAIDGCETKATTPAELNAQIEALETAVANVKTWREIYYTEKDKLVAQLERFEADYNNAEHGAWGHMCKSRWATAIEKVQAAVLAKDDLTSHEGLTTATEGLKTALDAVATSIGEYAELKDAIDNASTIVTSNIGDGPFQRSQSAIDAFSTENEQAVYDAAEKDGEEITSLTEALRNGSMIELNAPAEGDVFKVAIRFNDDWKFNNKPLTFADNGKDGVSLYEERDANFYAQTLILKKVEGNKYTMSTITTDGTELYASTGSASGNGSNTAQIRLTDDATKALSIEIIPTTTDGLYNLKNTEANALLGCQDDTSKEKGGLFTTNNRNNFTITKVDMPSVTIKTPYYWGTMILPFAAEIPEGLTVYSCADADGEVLTLKKVDKIEANTPYLICGATTEFEYTFTGFGTAATTAYTSGLFTGTYVDHETTANSCTYVLQNINDNVAFYLVGDGAQPTVGAYHCYITYKTAEGEVAAPTIFSLDRGGDTTDIAPSTLNSQLSTEIYDLMGCKVNAMEKGKMYIVNGQKVIVK